MKRNRRFVRICRQPSGRRVSFDHQYGFTGMAVYENGVMISYTCRMHSK